MTATTTQQKVMERGTQEPHTPQKLPQQAKIATQGARNVTEGPRVDPAMSHATTLHNPYPTPDNHVTIIP